METTLSRPIRTHSSPASAATSTPWYIYSALLATVSIVVGLRWDISWHLSVGRDGLFSPPHLAIYLGGILAGIGGSYQLFRTTFAGTPEEKAQSVWFWGFRSPLGALFSIWGALAMLTSAPFDDWWHNAYGLDVEILTPPHTVLLLGILMVQMGSVITLLTFQNKKHKEDALSPKHKAQVSHMYLFTIGMLLSVLGIMIWQYSDRQNIHLPEYYIVACITFPMFMVAAGKASYLKWAITAVALWYLGISTLINWVLQIFPATPKLGPVYSEVTHFVSLKFPFLLVVPALALDILRDKIKLNDWLMSLVLGTAFFAVFWGVQWFWGDFLMSPAARNWVFGSDALAYNWSAEWKYRHAYFPYRGTSIAFATDMLIACGYAILTTRLGLWWGNWMLKVNR